MGITKNHVFQSEFCPKFKYSDVKCHGFEAGIQDCSFRIEHADCDDIEHAGGIVCGTNENEGNNIFDRFFNLFHFSDKRDLFLCFYQYLLGYGSKSHLESNNVVLLGGNGPNEGNILVTGEGLVLGPLCDSYFGYDEVRCKRNFVKNVHLQMQY